MRGGGRSGEEEVGGRRESEGGSEKGWGQRGGDGESEKRGEG